MGERGKLDFKKCEIKVGALYGIYFPDRITKIVKEGKGAFIVELQDIGCATNKHLGVLKLEKTGYFEMRMQVAIDNIDGANFWFDAYEKEVA